MDSHDLPEGFRPDDPTAYDRARTDYTEITFTLKEGPNGEPWYMVEEDEPGLPILRRGDSFLGLRLRDGVTYNEAQAFLSELRQMVKGIAHTVFIT